MTLSRQDRETPQSPAVVQLLNLGWYQLPWEDSNEWDDCFLIEKDSPWEIWAASGEPVILLVQENPTVIMGFNFEQSERSVEDIIQEAVAIARGNNV